MADRVTVPDAFRLDGRLGLHDRRDRADRRWTDLLVTDRARPAVLLAPGALYLFWSAGVFYVFELIEDYDVILLVGEEYRQSDAFNRLLEQHPGIRACYVPRLRPVRRLHHYYATEARRIVDAYRPRFILSTDIWGMEMLYLFQFGRAQRARGHACGCIAIQASNWMKDGDRDLDEGRKHHATYYVRKYGMPRVMAGWLVTLLMHTFRVLNTFVYPAFYTGRPLRPWGLMFGPVSSRRDSVGKFDAFLYYSEGEGRSIRPLFHESCRVDRVVHPLRSREDAARNLLRAGDEQRAVIVLPSYASVLMLQGDLGLNEQAATEFLADRWIEVITRLRQRFPGYPVHWKIHPQLVNDPHWMAVTARISAAVPEFEVLDPSEKAEKLILEHHVIAGDISTALMWAANLPSKIVFSFDVFGVKYRELAGRDNIWYFDDLADFDRASFETFRPAGTGPAPTVREYLAQLH